MTGFAYLVGAGPGDPGLLTARAIEVLGRADVVLYDKLIPREALAYARPDAELIDVGKIGGGPQVPQVETERCGHLVGDGPARQFPVKTQAARQSLVVEVAQHDVRVRQRCHPAQRSAPFAIETTTHTALIP